ncbi:TIM barrel protein [Rouxiella badensis]|jgi:L-rhamnose isomerase|uniref:Xylose isomerase-like TIM barrel domain-containing protein n=1 Tax=Rouxiella badensis TaxID=1646377 RepID=A0A1X0WAV3_9GAMM|nr:TIM barrel protein [Rouxiella badensis]MCC3704264.1 TIM barrel protein [Rouxiella badensis]MCC3719715.1 TIM barrel protein [Rouxiella badensis]MCC3728965.1 TIM barrel protein [Rouxiella badensis]MCC3733392.1 TIM barrel protein [Rouxiella badensis]MCC3740839.1 TIM barrel protein [Rouxiella badensis]
MSDLKFATRLNSFASGAHLYWPNQQGKPSVIQMIERASTVKGLTHLDLNYPQHITTDIRSLRQRIEDVGLAVNGMQMRWDAPEFKIGAFTNPNPEIRRKAIELTKRGIDAGREFGSNLMTLWMGQDGFDYCFQADYKKIWEDAVSAVREVAEYAPDVDVSIEYKPNEPRAYSIFPNVTTCLIAVEEAGCPNLGITLDFAHVLYANEIPAYAAAMVSRRSRLLGLDCNDGWGKRDDGLMVASVNPKATLEFLWQMQRDGYQGAYYFDTFPDASGLDPVREAEANIATVKRLLKLCEKLDDNQALRAAIGEQDAVASQLIINDIMFS